MRSKRQQQQYQWGRTRTYPLEPLIMNDQTAFQELYICRIQQMNILQITVLLVLACLVFTTQEPYKKIIHNSDQNAKCLDGSPPALYLHEGGDPNKFLIFFVGGGYCRGKTLNEVLEQCYQRSKGENGGSKYLPDLILSPGGYLSTDPIQSKFATWTKFIIFYCDGAHHQGYNKDPVSYKDAQLYFRGEANAKSHFKWIANNYNFYNAEKVLLTGASAGGIATFLYSNYVKTLLKNPMALYTVADSGTFMNITNPDTGLFQFSEQAKSLFKISNADAKSPIERCNQKFQGQQYKCLFLENAFTSIEGRFMIINSQYDQVGLQDGIGIKCLKKGVSGKTLSSCNSTQLRYIEVYRQQFLTFVTNFMQFSKNSAWTIACCTHSYACYKERYNVAQQKVPGVTGLTVKDAIESFVFDDMRISSIDSVDWPMNQLCAY